MYTSPTKTSFQRTVSTCSASVEFCSHGNEYVPCFWMNTYVTSNYWLIQVMSYHCISVKVSAKNLTNEIIN